MMEKIEEEEEKKKKNTPSLLEFRPPWGQLTQEDLENHSPPTGWDENRRSMKFTLCHRSVCLAVAQPKNTPTQTRNWWNEMRKHILEPNCIQHISRWVYQHHTDNVCLGCIQQICLILISYSRPLHREHWDRILYDVKAVNICWHSARTTQHTALMLAFHNEAKVLSLSPLDGIAPQNPRGGLPEQSGTIWQFPSVALHVALLSLFILLISWDSFNRCVGTTVQS